MLNRLKAHEQYKNIKKDELVGKLLATINAIYNKFASELPLNDTLNEAKRKFELYKQGPQDTNAAHIKAIKTKYELIRFYGRDIVHNMLVKQMKEENTEVLDDSKSEVLITGNEASALLLFYKHDVYPRNPAQAIDLLNHHVVSNKLQEVSPSNGKRQKKKKKKKKR
mmetsp:Transcript_3520/g.4895  ORF Transcript_3520/g.4895 Transcript_3520/m.4895 type:complete len:167 (+) Transcript_3520:933-1433(+)